MDTYHWDVVGCFIWDLFETSRKRTNGTSLLRPFETSLRLCNKTSWRRTTETSSWRCIETLLGVSFGTYLRRHWDVQRDVVVTPPGRLNAGWEIIFKIRIFKKKVAILIFNSTCFTFFIVMFKLNLILWCPSNRLLTRLDNELAINLALSINCKM